MKLRSTILALLTGFALAACGGASKGKVTGTLKNANGKQLVFEKIENQQPVGVDTVKLDANGKFEFELPAGKIDFYRLNLGDNNFIVLCLDSSNKAEISGDATNLNETYTVKGSKNSEIIHDYFTEVNPITKKRFELENQLRGINFADTAMVMTMRVQMEDQMRQITDITHKYIDKYPTSPAVIVMQSFLNPQTELVYFQKIEKALAASMPNSVYHNQVTTFISQIQYQQQQMQQQEQLQAAVKPGTDMTDIVMMDPSGKERKFSDLKGKVVLVDFWASWCRPCRAENPNVVKLYEKYKNKGFDIFSVSLDKDKAAWEKAIADDGLVWPNHVSDLAQWQSVVIKQFGINSIPFTLLVGRDGKIIDKGLRGPALEQKLAELFGS